jgi:hypothetical protein
MRASFLAAFLGVVVAAAADAPPAPVSVKTADVEITARLIIDPQGQIKAVGSELNRQYVIVELSVTPRGGYPLTLSRDDFLLRSERDNERATADSPDRIAGAAVLVLGSGRTTRAPIHSESGDPVYVGGIPGTGTGPPRRVGVQNDTFGTGPGSSSSSVNSSTAKTTPLLDALRNKELPLGETGKRASGYLYFSVDPKQKAKNFHLHFKGPTESADLRFK